MKYLLQSKLTEYFDSIDKEVLVLYHFCSNRTRGVDEMGSTILCSWIHQLLKHKPALISILLDSGVVDSHSGHINGHSSYSLKRLWEIFKLLIKSSGCKTLLIMADALDECEKDSAEELILLLPEILNQEADMPAVKILFTSRDEIHIKENLPKEALSLDLVNERTRESMERYFSRTPACFTTDIPVSNFFILDTC